MCGSMVDVQSAAAGIRRGIKKKIEDRKKSQGKNVTSASATQGGHKKTLIPGQRFEIFSPALGKIIMMSPATQPAIITSNKIKHDVWSSFSK